MAKAEEFVVTSYSPVHVQGARQRNYKPWVLRFPYLISVFLTTILFIALLEYASRTLPHASSVSADTVANALHLSARQAAVSVSTTSSYHPVVASTSAQSAYVATASTTSLRAHTFYAASTDFVATVTTVSQQGSPTSATNPDAFVRTVSTSSVVSVTVPSIYTEVAGVFLPTASTSSVKGVIASTTASAVYVLTESSVLGGNAAVSIGGDVATGGEQTFFTVSTANYVSTEATVLPSPAMSSYVSTATSRPTIPKVGSAAPGGFVATKGTSALLPGSTLVSSSNDTGTINSTNASVVIRWPVWKAFVGAYLPVLLAVIYRVLWSSMCAAVKLYEPFSQLIQPEGGLAKDTLFAYYLSSNLTPDPILGFFKGHWVILHTSLVYLVAGSMTSLASESLYVDTHYCANPSDNSNNPCWPRMSINPVMLRLLEGLLSYVAIMTLVIMAMIWRRSSGLCADPSAIATVASLVHHPEVLDDLRSIPAEATHADMKRLLGAKRYRLADYQTSDGTVRYGIVPVNANPSTSARNWTTGNSYAQVHNPAPSPGSGRTRLQTLDKFLDVGLGVVVVGVLAVIVAYYLDGSNSGFNRFFNSRGFGPRFLMATIGTLIAAQWKRVERTTQTLAPYMRLSSSPAPASSTILFSTPTLTAASIIALLYHHHVLPAVVACTTILAEVLVITITGVPFASGQTWLQFLVSVYLSTGILGIMVLVVVALLFWRRRAPHLPRDPDTLAAVMSYVGASRMLDDFEGLEGTESKERDRTVKSWGKTYGYGWFVGRDGVGRWAVDEDARRAEY